MTLRKELIRLAHANPKLQPKLLPLLLPKMAAAMSITDGINKALGEHAGAMGKFLVRKYPKSFSKMSGSPYAAGAFAQAVSAEINNQEDSSRPGDLGVEASWKVGQSRFAVLRVWGRFPTKTPGGSFEREIALKLSESPSGAVSRLGPAFVRDLDTWMGNMGWAS